MKDNAVIDQERQEMRTEGQNDYDRKTYAYVGHLTPDGRSPVRTVEVEMFGRLWRVPKPLWGFVMRRSVCIHEY